MLTPDVGGAGTPNPSRYGELTLFQDSTGILSLLQLFQCFSSFLVIVKTKLGPARRSSFSSYSFPE